MGVLSIRPPSVSGSQYIISTTSIENLIQSEESSTFIWKVIGVSFFVASGVCLSYWFYKRYFLKYLERKRYEMLRAELLHGNVDDNDVTSCIICLERPRDVVLLECGHVYTCKQCTERLQMCPVCRHKIDRFVPIFHG